VVTGSDQIFAAGYFDALTALDAARHGSPELSSTIGQEEFKTRSLKRGGFPITFKEGRHLAVSPNGFWYVKHREAGDVTTHDASTGELLERLTPAEGKISRLVISADERWIAGTSSEGPVNVWNLSRDEHFLLPANSGDRIGPLAFQPGSERLATAVGHDIRVWDLADRTIVDTLAWDGQCEPATWRVTPDLWNIRYLAFSPEGRRLAVGASCEATTEDTEDSWHELLWDVKDRKILGEFSEADCSAAAAVFTLDGRRLIRATDGFGGQEHGCNQERLEVYDVSSMKRLAEFDAPDQSITSLGFSHDGRRLVLGDISGFIVVRETRWPDENSRQRHNDQSR
jgi:WD40 repeat protein